MTDKKNSFLPNVGLEHAIDSHTWILRPLGLHGQLLFGMLG